MELIKNGTQDQQLSNDFLKDLDDFIESEQLKDYEIEMNEISKQTFKIQNEGQANFFINKIKEIRSEKEKIQEAAKQEIEYIKSKIQKWQESNLTPLNSQENYFTGLLEEYAIEQLEGKDKKTLKLTYGNLTFRKQQDKFEYEDAKLLAFLKDNNLNSFIKTKEEPKKSELKKKAIVKDNCLFLKDLKIDGVIITPQEHKFEIK